MANHGFVKTKKPMTPDAIQAILEELNVSTFKNGFKIERDDKFWNLSYPSNERNYGYRSCWLETKRTFEMRHSGGASFIWWADSVILDTIARKFDGTISDEGHSNKWKPRERNWTLSEYIQEVHPYGLPPVELEFIPPEFRDLDGNQESLIARFLNFISSRFVP
jgi:hypothetical protein